MKQKAVLDKNDERVITSIRDLPHFKEIEFFWPFALGNGVENCYFSAMVVNMKTIKQNDTKR